MAIIRQNNETNFVQINNETVRDTKLSWEATGMLALLLSHSDNFNISISRLEKAKTNGGTSTKRILLELRQKGYVHFVTLTKSNKGEFTGSIWDIFGIAREPDPRLTDEQKEGFNRLKNNNFKTGDYSYIRESKTEGMDTEHADTEGMDKGHTLEEQSKNTNCRITNDKNNNIAISQNRDEIDNLFELEKYDKPKVKRTRDLLFEAVAKVSSIDITAITRSGRGELNSACKQLREVNATPEMVYQKADILRAKYSVPITPSSLAKHWGGLNIASVENIMTDRERNNKLTEHYKDNEFDRTFAIIEQNMKNKANEQKEIKGQ